MEDHILDDKEYKKYIINIFNKFKRKNKWDNLQMIPVYNDENIIVAYLRPITFDFQYTTPEIIQLITKWKIQNPSISASIMQEITCDMTRQWIKKYLLERQDKLIFLIQDLMGNYLGYMGVATFDFKNRTLQLDSACRGVKNVIPGLMTFVAKSLILFSYGILKVNDIVGTATDANPYIKSWHQRIGYEIYDRIPLKLIKVSKIQQRWIQDSSLTTNIERYSIKVKINKQKYKQQVRKYYE